MNQWSAAALWIHSSFSNHPKGTWTMHSKEIAGRLKSQSTWRLLFLSLITLGIYTSHYIKRQTTIINEHLDKDREISQSIVTAILVLSYLTAILIVPYVMVEEGHPLEKVSDSLDKVWSLLVLIWAFMARNRMNALLAAAKGEPHWFHGLWTFLFAVFYFNFKINKINNDLAEPTASPDGGHAAPVDNPHASGGPPSVG